MKIDVNGVPRDVRSETLDDALVELGLSEAKVATALNGEFVPAPSRAAMKLKEGDRLEVLGPMQGG